MNRSWRHQPYRRLLLLMAAASIPHFALAGPSETLGTQGVLDSPVWRAFVTIVEREFEEPLEGATLDALCARLVHLRAERSQATSAADCVREVASVIDTRANFTAANERLPSPTGSGNSFGSFALELRRKLPNEPLFIESTIYGGPGALGGLLPEDAILAVDGESLLPLSIEDCVRRLRGAPGTVATLRISRNGSEFEARLTREVIRIQYVRAQFIEGGIAHVRISAFVKGVTAPQLATAATRLWTTSQTPVTALVLDLRSNFGGDLKEVFAVASMFTEPGTALLTSATRSGVESFTSQPRSDRPSLPEPVAKYLESAPLVVLVNGKTSSGAEALAFLLQRDRKAQTIGERTAGLTEVRQLRELPDGSTIQLTIGRLISPIGRNWSIDGVDIDHVVPDISGYEYGQLPADKALLYAITMIRNRR